MLFEEPPEFRGLPREGFDTFGLPRAEQRRRAIIETIHPSLEALGQDLLHSLNRRAAEPLHRHLPRLDWPRDYEPFCTWLALSRESHGYQAGPQLNVGVHPDHVAVRLGWDAGADAFGRFEFLCRHGDLGDELVQIAARQCLRFRVYTVEPWPAGSKCIFDSADDLRGSLDELRTQGLWWEVGKRYEVPQQLDLVCSAALGPEAERILGALLPAYDRIVGHAVE